MTPAKSPRRHRISPATGGALFYLCFYGSTAVYIPFLSVFYSERGLSGREIGLLVAIGPLISLLLSPTITALADRRGWQLGLLRLGLAGGSLTLLLLPLMPSFVLLLLVTAAMAVAFNPIIPLADGLIAQIAARRDLSYGKMRLWGSVSWVVIPTVGGVLWQQVGLTPMFPVAAILMLATIPIVRFVGDTPVSETHAAHPPGGAWGDRRLQVMLAGGFLFGLGLSMSVTFAAIYLAGLGGQTLVGGFSGVAALTEIPAMQNSERLMRRLGGPRTLLLACLFMGSAYLMLALITDPVVLLGAALLRGMGFGLFTPTVIRLIAGWAPPGRTTSYQGLLNAAQWGLAPLVAGPLGGAVYDAAGAPALFLIATATAVGAGLVLALAPQGSRGRPAETAAPPPAPS
jgi:MFS transporter, PPP family, 3-phenylpropionic acid transporter